jgi:Ca-activated chloride channel family protein
VTSSPKWCVTSRVSARLRRVFRLGLAVALSLVVVPAAAAQTPDTRNRALIVLDASKSMNEDAGNGGTRLDAAKAAVDALVDRLPAGAPLGLRVYGSKVSEVSRAEGCKDTELTVPVGPLDKDALRGTVNRLTGKGRTPIGASLLAVPDDLGAAEGRRSVVLVTDGGDNCAPPDPCKAAEEVARRGVEMSISVVGFQVNDRVRKQLRCIARAGGGSYVDVEDADELGGELSALLSRAFRSYEPTGTKIEGGASAAQAKPLGEGQFLQTIPAGDFGERWFSIDVPAGVRAFVSTTAIPPRPSSGQGLLRTTLYTRGEYNHTQGFTNDVIHGTSFDDVNGFTTSQSVRTQADDPPGPYDLSVEIGKVGTGDGLDADVPIEISVQFVKPGENVKLANAPGALATPAPSATPRPKVTATPAPAEDGGGSGGWLVLVLCVVAGIGVGFLASGVLMRRAAA